MTNNDGDVDYDDNGISIDYSEKEAIQPLNLLNFQIMNSALEALWLLIINIYSLVLYS